MEKNEFIERVRKCGDAIITYRSTNSRKLKYNVCTLDFSTPHIQQKHNRANETRDTVLLFIVPLNSILKNKGIYDEW